MMGDDDVTAIGRIALGLAVVAVLAAIAGWMVRP
tara:strand:+ start:2089 stop:2190 length:102 start_codon:yes stop_codon:yes gene_type:complete